MMRKLIWIGVLTVCLCGVLTGMMARDARDWLDSDRWHTAVTDDFTITPKVTEVIYRYTVDGQTYEGTRTHFFVLSPHDDRRVNAWFAEYRSVLELTVYYNPDAPGRAVLVREVARGWMITRLVGTAVLLVMMSIPVLVFGSLWRWMRREFSS